MKNFVMISALLRLLATGAAFGADYVADFSQDQVGGEPASFAPVVGVWRVGIEKENKVFMVDGSRWKEGEASANLADKARAIR